MISNSQAVKKCPACGEYSAWNNEVTDVCTFCGNILDPVKLKETREDEEIERQAKLRFEHPVFWVSIKPGDKPFVVLWKKLLQGAQIVYMAIISFLLWVAAAVAG